MEQNGMPDVKFVSREKFLLNYTTLGLFKPGAGRLSTKDYR